MRKRLRGRLKSVNLEHGVSGSEFDRCVGDADVTSMSGTCCEIDRGGVIAFRFRSRLGTSLLPLLLSLLLLFR